MSVLDTKVEIAKSCGVAATGLSACNDAIRCICEPQSTQFLDIYERC